jgi:ubiquinone/menaquinone biosynthesis C-methylase UbiE
MTYKNDDLRQGESVNWDYSAHAQYYDKRADYSREAIDSLISLTSCTPLSVIADIGAGTGKLTKELLRAGLSVQSIEPNDAMRLFGIRNTEGQSVKWSKGTGEATGLENNSVHGAFFGSSFNVVNQTKALDESVRILTPGGWFACMWNHRDLNDPIQSNIENIIKSHIPNYSYGSRREDPTAIINSNGHFSKVQTLESRFLWGMEQKDIITAWKSHATLRRQTGSDQIFNKVIEDIESYLINLDGLIRVPYNTKIYFAQLIKAN